MPALLAAAAVAGLLLAGFSALWMFRTVTLTTDPTTWIEIYAIRFGSGFSSGEGYGRPPTEVLYKFDKEVRIEPRPSSITATTCQPGGSVCFGTISFSPTSWSVTPVRREMISVVGWSSATYEASLYAFSMDIDAAKAGLPDISAVVAYLGRTGNTYVYNLQTIVSGYPPMYPEPGEHRSYWRDTYMVFRVDPWYRPVAIRVDGIEVVPPGEPCLARGECKFILPVASQAPDSPIASGYTLLERLYPHTAGQRSIVKIHLVELVVDPSVVVATAPTTIFGPTLTAPGYTTVTVPVTQTVVVTERQIVTRTYTVSSYIIMYATTTVVEGRTITTTVTRAVTSPQTMVVEAPTRTVTTTVLGPGERLTITVTRTIHSTVTETRLLDELLGRLLSGDVLPLLIGAATVVLVATIIAAAAVAASRSRAAPPRRPAARTRRRR